MGRPRDRQENPRAVTAGVSYTPFPLLTLNAERRQGQGHSDSRVGLDLTLQPGVPWEQQLRGDEVAARRTLAGSHHDLVDRNNNIVLEYRKKELLKLTLNDPVPGRPQEQKPLVASLTTKYPFERFAVSAPALLQAEGAKLDTDVQGRQITATLPWYNWSLAPERNTYPVTEAGAGDAVTVRYCMKDDQNGPIPADPAQVRLTVVPANGAKQTGPWVNDDDCVTAVVTTGEEDGTVRVTAEDPRVPGSEKTTEVVVSGRAPDRGNSSLDVSPASFRVGNSGSTVTVEFRDHHNIPVALTDEQLGSLRAACPFTGKQASADISGFRQVPGVMSTYEATLTSTVPGECDVSLTLTGRDFVPARTGNRHVSVTGGPGVAQVILNTDKDNYTADEQVQLIVEVKDPREPR